MSIVLHNQMTYSIGSSQSRLSALSSSKNKKTLLHGKFETSLQFFLYTLAYTLSIDSFSFMYKVGQHNTELNLVQYFISYIVVGIPLYYMQMFLGQYTQMSMVHLRHMIPFGHGLIYTSLIIVFLYTIKYGMSLGDYFLYFLLSWQRNLPWMICHSGNINREWGNCFNGFSNLECVGNCQLNKTYTSAYLYYLAIYLRMSPNDTQYFSVNVPSLHRTIGSVTAWTVVFFFTVYICPRWPKVLYVLVYQFYILLTLLNMGTISTRGGLMGLRIFFKGTWEKIGSLLAWCRSISIAVQQLRLAHAFIVLNASKLRQRTGNAGVLTVGFCTISFLSSLFCVVFFQSCIGMLIRRGNWTSTNLIHIGMSHHRGRCFVVIPQSLGYLTVPQIWSLLYFSCAISISLANQVTHIHTLHSSLADICPSARKYQNYIILGYCISACTFCIAVLGESKYIFTDYFQETILTLLEMINISYLAFLVFWIYGVRRLGDDICFTFGAQPTKFWKITWYLLPFVTVLSGYYEYSYHMSKPRTILYKTSTIFVILACTCPIPILTFVEIFKHMKARNLIGLFRPTYMWGSPDPEERHRRSSFNPRKETAYNSNVPLCKHNCLLHSRILKNLIEPEARCTQTYLKEVLRRENVVDDETAL
ncbi:hypothetical protein Trydic_g4820 [Trypoxylus dichotomus]